MRPRILAIDWSGAKDAKNSIAVAALDPGDTQVKLLGPPDGWRWTRMGVLELLKERAEGGVPTVAGIDCNFSLPFVDHDYYVRKFDIPPAQELWKEVDRVCEEEEESPEYKHKGAHEFYAESFVDRHSKEFWREKRQPAHYEERYRKVDRLTKGAQSAFALNSSQQVGRAGLAGMRILHQLAEDEFLNTRIAVWPFEERNENTRLVIVEIFPTFYRRVAGVKRNNKIGSRTELDAALYSFGFTFAEHVSHSLTDDETDALVSVAGMAKAFSDFGLDALAVPEFDKKMQKVRETEGWIFGVPWPERGLKP